MDEGKSVAAIWCLKWYPEAVMDVLYTSSGLPLSPINLPLNAVPELALEFSETGETNTCHQRGSASPDFLGPMAHPTFFLVTPTNR
jgi:hypothetical protein